MDLTVQLKNFLDSQSRLTAFPAKQKMKLAALFYLAGKFEPGKSYTEKEINELLCLWHTFNDPATLRRELYQNKFLNRAQDGSSYCLEDPQPIFPVTN